MKRLAVYILFFSLLSPALFLYGTPISYAGLFRVESEALGSFRSGLDNQTELPLYEFVGASFVSENRELEINTNFSLMTDAKRKLTDSDLYILDLTYKAIPDLLSIKMGRFFDVYRSTRTMTSDTVGAEVTLLDKQITLGGYGGIERELVLGKFDPSASVLGAYGNYISPSVFPFYFSTRYRRRSFASPTKAPENIFQLSLHKPFPGTWNPELLLNSEAHAPGILDRLETGIDLFPNYNTSFRLRALTFDAQKTYGVEQPIFSIFSQGRLYEAMGQLEYRFTSLFSSSIAFSYDDYQLQTELNHRGRGYRLEIDTQFVTDYSSIINSIYGFYSPGGRAYGDQIKFGQKLSNRLDLQESAEVTFYDKITSAKRFIFSTQAGMNYWLENRFKLYFGGEFNTNNILRYDVRVIAKLTYLLWVET